MGLIPAIKRYISNFIERTGIDVLTDLPEKIDLSGEKNICIFRVVQEALTNVHKHAHTSWASIHLKVENKQAVLRIRDNGKGFNASLSSTSIISGNAFGLMYMKERVENVGGKRTITSQINRGCLIEVTIPLDESKQDNSDANN